MGSPLAECVEPADIENIEENKIVENEMKAVKSLLEAGAFDIEMDIHRSKANAISKLLVKELTRNSNSSEMLIEKSISE